MNNANIKYISVEEIRINPYQPRKEMVDSELDEIVSSIKKYGILQPILVRKNGNGYQIIAGERRYRASKKLGLEEIPVIEMEVNDREMLELAMIENLHREDISPIDKAEGFKRLLEDFRLTQRELANIFGISRPAIANTIRLTELPEKVKYALRKKEITEGHARSLLGIKNEKVLDNLLKRIKERSMTVRECEGIVRELSSSNTRNIGNLLPVEREYERMLSEKLGTKVRLKKEKTGGRIEIEYYSQEDLERIIETI